MISPFRKKAAPLFRILRGTRNVSLLLLLAVTNLCAQIEDWHNVQINALLENEQVHRYLTEVEYNGIISRNSDNIAYSHIADYATVATDYRKDQPAAAIVPLPEATTEELQLVYADSEDPDNTTTITIPAGSTEVSIWNLIPGRTYTYSVGDITEGEIHTNGQLRQIRIDSGFNVRDIGGYPAGQGKHLRYGLIYRGSELMNGPAANVTPADLAELQRLGCAAELDLRANYTQTESAFGADVPFLHLELNDGTRILTEYATEIGQAITFIHDNLKEGRPVYVHCTYGADRTGTLIAALEALCGVAIGDIYKDYELTSMNDKGDGSFMRYYYTINQRLIRLLYIYNANNVASTVRSHLINSCGVSATLLDDLVDMLVEEDQVATGINHQTSTINHQLYTLQGQRLSTAPHRGLYIQDGKKHLVR